MSIPQTIKDQISSGTDRNNNSGKYLFMCWGASMFAAMTNGLCFKVRGLKLKGKVLVMLDEASDLYDIKFYNRKNNLVDSHSGVYWEDLTQLIDTVVESGEKNHNE